MLAGAAEARAYWEQRAQRFAGVGAGLGAVCSYGMPEFYNRYIYVTQWLALRPWLRGAAGTKVLDVGCGVGRWTTRLARAGCAVTAVDVAMSMVAQARHRVTRDGVADRCRFVVADVAGLMLNERFDRIFVVTVLQHILDDGRFQASVARLADHLAPGGFMLILEAAPVRARARCNSAVFVARPADVYRTAFTRAGLRCLAVRGVDPAPFKLLFLPWYQRLPRRLGQAGLALVTALSLPVDMIGGGWAPRFSWHRLFVLARQ
jgi:2-polyprenyl-3-methyl-5-hydroxy-6-metoxy-1,4-benzoquinol methylase